MDGKAIGKLIALAVLVLFAGSLSFYFDVDSKQKELQEARVQLENRKESHNSRLAMLETAKANHQSVRLQIDKFAALTSSKQELATKVATLESEIKDTTAKFVKLVTERRASATGTVLPSMTMPGGQVLQQVTLQKLTESEVSLSHSGGFMRVPVGDLPEAFKSKFRYGLPPMVKAPAPPPQSSPAPPESTAAPAPTPPTVNLSALAGNIESIRQHILTLEKTLEGWKNSAAGYRDLARRAQQRGTPTYGHLEKARSADQQVAVVTAQIQKLRQELWRIQNPSPATPQ